MIVSKNKDIKIEQVLLICLGMVVLVLLIGCSGTYGSLKRDQQVQEAFESNRLPTEYNYYYYGFDTAPYVIFGIEPKYELKSKMWRQAAPDTEEFKEMTRWIWEDYGYHKFGADILDPNGKKVGILFSAIYDTSVKFLADNQIAVMPSTPFLWGPDGDHARTP
jgi:hypothetical protein